MAKKTCPKCSKQVGPRTKVCECGHEFRSDTPLAVPAGDEPMSLDRRIASTVASPPPLDSSLPALSRAAKDTLAKVKQYEGRKTPDAPETAVKSEKKARYCPPTGCAGFGGVITVPAGSPPVKPKGYKADGDHWPDGQPTETDIVDWAYAVLNAGIERGVSYAPEAVVYWARYFWDINGPDFARVRGLILTALKPQIPDHDPADESVV